MIKTTKIPQKKPVADILLPLIFNVLLMPPFAWFVYSIGQLSVDDIKDYTTVAATAIVIIASLTTIILIFNLVVVLRYNHYARKIALQN